MSYVHKCFPKLYHVHIRLLEKEKNSFHTRIYSCSLQKVKLPVKEYYAASILKSRSKSSTSFSFTKVHSTLLLQRVPLRMHL